MSEPDELLPLPCDWLREKVKAPRVISTATTNSTAWVAMLARLTRTPELTATDTASPRRWK